MDELNDKLTGFMQQINEDLQNISLNLNTIDKRLGAVEKTHQQVKNDDEKPPAAAILAAKISPQESGIQESGEFPLRTDHQNISTEDIQGDFKSVKDSYSRTTIASDLRLFAEKSGIKRDDFPRYNTVVNCAKYSETILKVLTCADENGLSQDKCDEIATIVVAQQRYLQEEYANLLVNSTFNTQTAKLFKQLQRNASSFPASAISNLQAAATITAATHQQQSQSDRGSRGRGYRGRGRGRYRGQSDIYNNFTNRDSVPQHRSDNESCQ